MIRTKKFKKWFADMFRKKLFRYVLIGKQIKVEYNNPVLFVDSPPAAKHSFTARHIYNYNKYNNTFTFLGVQKAQSLKRRGTWVNQIIIAGFTDTNINGTYIRTLPGQIFYKDANHYITADRILIENGNTVGEVVIDINDPANSFLQYVDQELYPYDGTPPNPNILYDNLNVDNTTLNNINNNRLYTDTNPDYNRAQLLPNLNFNIDTVSNKTIIIVIYLFTEEIYFKMLNQ